MAMGPVLAGDRFEAYGPSHQGALVLLLVGLVAIVLFGRRHRATVLVWAAVYLVWALGLGPDWRRYRVALAVTATWALTVYALNVVAGTNYGYLNAKPIAASALDLLGPWPWYVLNEIVIVAALWALITWPWARRSRPAQDAAHPAAATPVGSA